MATEPHQLDELRERHRRTRQLGFSGEEFLDRDQVRAQVDSPTFLGGLWDRRGVAMLHPAKLAWGLKRACRGLGVRIYEHTPALELARSGAGMAVRTPYGRVFARDVALGTNVFPSLVKRVRPYTVPVYDYALMTEPSPTAGSPRSAGGTARAWATAPTSSTISGSPRTTGSSGAGTTRSIPTAAVWIPRSTTGRRPS